MSKLDVDLHDLNALRTRSLMFIHNLVEALRTAGVSACRVPHEAPCLTFNRTTGRSLLPITAIQLSPLCHLRITL